MLRVIIIFLVPTLITIFLVLIALTFKDTLPPLIIAIGLWPAWMFICGLLAIKDKNIDLIQYQNYSNLDRIRQNTDKVNHG